MEFIGKLCLCALGISLIACNDGKEPEPVTSEITPIFTVTKLDACVGETVLPCLVFRDKTGKESKYRGGESGWKWSVTDNEVARMNLSGEIEALSQGTTTVTVSNSSATKKAVMTLRVLRAGALEDGLSKEMIYTTGKQLKYNAVMQSFDIAGEDLYCAQLGSGTSNHLIVVNRLSADGGVQDFMTLKYFGHASTIVVDREEDGTDRIWIGSHGTRTSTTDFSYRLSQTVGRFAYRPGVNLTTATCLDHLWIPQRRNIHPALDRENGIAAFWSQDKNGNGYINTYRLSDIEKIPPVEKTLSFKNTTGAGNTSEPEVTDYPTAVVRDLSTITPLSTFQIKQKSDMQGFEVAGGRIYYYEGKGNNNDGKAASTAWVSVYSLDGRLVEQTAVNAVSDIAALNAQGLTDTGYMEPESLKMKDGALYLGFAARGSDNVRRVAILKYRLR